MPGKESSLIINLIFFSPTFWVQDIFCTPSIALEYIHLNEIKNFNTDLIEMETAGFYLMADLIEVPSIALLVVSDNSSTGVALIGRTKEEQNNYNHGRYDLLPTLIFDIVNMK